MGADDGGEVTRSGSGAEGPSAHPLNIVILAPSRRVETQPDATPHRDGWATRIGSAPRIPSNDAGRGWSRRAERHDHDHDHDHDHVAEHDHVDGRESRPAMRVGNLTSRIHDPPGRPGGYLGLRLRSRSVPTRKRSKYA